MRAKGYIGKKEIKEKLKKYYHLELITKSRRIGNTNNTIV